MALIKCEECGTEISEYAENCPSCGINRTPTKSEENSVKKKANIIGFAAIGMLISIFALNLDVEYEAILIGLIGLFVIVGIKFMQRWIIAIPLLFLIFAATVNGIKSLENIMFLIELILFGYLIYIIGKYKKTSEKPMLMQTWIFISGLVVFFSMIVYGINFQNKMDKLREDLNAFKVNNLQIVSSTNFRYSDNGPDITDYEIVGTTEDGYNYHAYVQHSSNPEDKTGVAFTDGSFSSCNGNFYNPRFYFCE